MEGLFGNMWEKAMLKIVEVKEKDGARKKLQPCVFCDKGDLKCDGCEGTGKDIALGGNSKCFACNGKGTRVCSVCQGVGYVDKVRRGGTDTKGEYLGVDKKAMDPLTPQYAPFILELDEATKYVWCQCGVSMKQVRLPGHMPMIEYACTHMCAHAHAHAHTHPQSNAVVHAQICSHSATATATEPTALNQWHSRQREKRARRARWSCAGASTLARRLTVMARTSGSRQRRKLPAQSSRRA